MSKSKKVAVSYHTLKFMTDLAAVLRPKPPMTVTEWAEAHMVLPAGSNEPGRYSSKNMPFQADIMNRSVRRPAIRETTALGAAYLAGLAVGVWKNQDEIRNLWACDMIYKPDMEETQRKKLLSGWHKAVSRSRDWTE